MPYRGYPRHAPEYLTSLNVGADNLFVSVILIQGETAHDKLKTLNSCNCCERHKTNRPEHLDSKIEINSGVKSYEMILCGCDCRHLARMICYDPTVCSICSE